MFLGHIIRHYYQNYLSSEGGLKSSYDDVVSVSNVLFGQWDPSTKTPIEKVHGPQGGLCKK